MKLRLDPRIVAGSTQRVPWSDTSRHSGSEALAALNGGYQLAFLAGAGLTVAAAVLGALLLRPRESASRENSLAEAG